MAKLILIRHGKTKLFHEQRFWGKTNVELSDEGIRQSELLRDRLAREKIKAVFSSQLSRASKTAEIIAAKHSIEVIRCAELNECNFGYVEGLTFTEIQNLHPKLAKDLNSFDTMVKFPGGESFLDLDARVKEFIKRLKEYKDKDTVVIVAHSGTLLLIICHLLEIEIKHWRKMRSDPGSITVIDTYSSGVIMSSLNDVSHLKK